MESIQSFDVKEKIVESVLEVFDTMLSMELQFQDKVAQQYMYGTRLLGTINLVGEVMGIATIQVGEDLSHRIREYICPEYAWSHRGNNRVAYDNCNFTLSLEGLN